MVKSMIKKKKELDMNEIMLDINQLITTHDCTFVKSCDKKGKILSLTSIDHIECKKEDKLIYLERLFNKQLETVNAFSIDYVHDITYETEFKDESKALVVTMGTY